MALRSLRRLRGTALDPFGHTAMRRTERTLIEEYRTLVDAAFSRIQPDAIEEVIAIAELPDMIRGYEEVKRGNIERFRAEAATLLAALDTQRVTGSTGSN
jgi:indolepyruvate ferredoxin oxidoreductase